MELIIKGVSGNSQNVTLQPTDRIGTLKQLIAPHFGVTAKLLKLSAASGQILDNDQLTVSEYGLSSGSTVMVLISATPMPFQVLVKNVQGLIKTYDMAEDDTVKQLMKKINHKERIPVDQQRLTFNTIPLQPDGKLQDYGINSGMPVEMTLRLRGG